MNAIMDTVNAYELNSDVTREMISPKFAAEWEPALSSLWSPTLSEALEAAASLYKSDGQDFGAPQNFEEGMADEFWRLLMHDCPGLPDSPVAMYKAVLRVVRRILQGSRLVRSGGGFSTPCFVLSLRPVRRLQAGILAAEVCAALHDYHRGTWTPCLNKPQRALIEYALAKTIAALPPKRMEAYWENLHSADPMIRQAMRLGLKFMRSHHALPHLLHGLETSRDHDIRADIVDILEQIGEPHSIPTLTRLRRETAVTDWTLSRHIARALKVIERQNPGYQGNVLLRPAQSPPPDPDVHLRPVAEIPRNDEADRRELLRPQHHEGEKF